MLAVWWVSSAAVSGVGRSPFQILITKAAHAAIFRGVALKGNFGGKVGKNLERCTGLRGPVL